jgi:hypothetical protein
MCDSVFETETSSGSQYVGKLGGTETDAGAKVWDSSDVGCTSEHSPSYVNRELFCKGKYSTRLYVYTHQRKSCPHSVSGSRAEVHEFEIILIESERLRAICQHTTPYVARCTYHSWRSFRHKVRRRRCKLPILPARFNKSRMSMRNTDVQF